MVLFFNSDHSSSSFRAPFDRFAFAVSGRTISAASLSGVQTSGIRWRPPAESHDQRVMQNVRQPIQIRDHAAEPSSPGSLVGSVMSRQRVIHRRHKPSLVLQDFAEDVVVWLQRSVVPFPSDPILIGGISKRKRLLVNLHGLPHLQSTHPGDANHIRGA
jgi:hypothetical protein